MNLYIKITRNILSRLEFSIHNQVENPKHFIYHKLLLFPCRNICEENKYNHGNRKEPEKDFLSVILKQALVYLLVRIQTTSTLHNDIIQKTDQFTRKFNSLHRMRNFSISEKMFILWKELNKR